MERQLSERQRVFDLSDNLIDIMDIFYFVEYNLSYG